MSDLSAEASRSEQKVAQVKSRQTVLLFLLFLLICLGLGYAQLNRYDPAKLPGTSDVGVYREMVVGRTPQGTPGPSDAYSRLAQWENRYRVLVPDTAKPIYWLTRNHLKTWDPALFGLLVANALFTATTACLLVSVGYRLTLDFPTALLGGTLYLLNFCVVNLNLVGLVDSAEGCFVMAIVWSLLDDRWFLLPLWGVLGALAKETFAPLSGMFVFGWWLAAVRRDRLQLRHLVWVGALGVASLATVTITMSIIAGGLVWPWEFAAFAAAGNGFLAGLRGSILDHTFWYVFIWMLPLGLVRLRRLPQTWVAATAAAFCGALVLGAYNDARGNTTRALFNVAGPLLSLSTAVFLAGLPAPAPPATAEPPLD